MMRDRMSRPNSSVPRRYWTLGAVRRARRSWSAGSFGARYGANTAMNTMTMTITPPIIPNVLRRKRRQTSLPRDAAARACGAVARLTSTPPSGR